MSKNSIYHSPQMVEAVLPHYPLQKKSKDAFRILFVGCGEPGDSLIALKNHDLISAPNYYQANILLNRLHSQSHQLPDAVIGLICRADAKGLRDFISFLKGATAFSGIPLIIIDRKGVLSRGQARPVKGIDEIITGEMAPGKLGIKIALLKKFKALKLQQSLKRGQLKNDIPNARQILYKTDGVFKRVMDMIISLVALIILSPLMLVIAVAIKMDSKGPVFYKSYRAGSNYRVFKFIKFRTMIMEADNRLSGMMNMNQYTPSEKRDPVFVKISNDPRITRFGKFLRNTSLDEIPQLFNVLKGDMSLVGNRPLPLYEAKTLTTDSLAERFNAPAGITGLWQISKRGQKEMSAEERIALDIQYARANSFANDLQIMLKTPKAMIQKDNV